MDEAFTRWQNRNNDRGIGGGRMKAVYKYTGKLNDVVSFAIPIDGEILRIDMQDETSGLVCLWR